MTKTLKNGLLVITLLAASLAVNAQEKIVTFGVRATAALVDFHAPLKSDGLADIDSKFGYGLGVTVDFAFSPSIYLLTGIDFMAKGATEFKYGHDRNVEAQYLILPLHFGYKLQIDDNPKFVFRAGPYVGYGIGGKTKIKGENVKFDTFSAEGYKKVDFGLGAAVGAELEHIKVDLGANFGLLDISEQKENIKTKDFYVSFGYKF